ncbi:MAG: sensor histidine kinase [Cellulosilyticaceae bacterium]
MKRQYNIMKVDLKKLLKLTLMINIIHIILIVGIIVYITIKPTNELYILLCISAILITFSSTLMGISYYYIINFGKNNVLETINNLEAFNITLREERHDYINHMQVVYGLMELGEYEEARRYMEPVYREILKLSKALKTAHPALNALLQAKFQMADSKGIAMYLEIKTDLKYMGIEPWELCKVLSNIIDNGITALNKKEDNKNLYLDISEYETTYRIDIYNNGPMISKEVRQHLFESDVTTSKEEGHGMGLYIVNKILEKVGGDITMTSVPDKTCFTIVLPKNNHQR